MKILFDQGTPVPLRRLLTGHQVDTAFEKGWSTLRNGELIARAEAEGYDLFITTDANLKHQQDLARRSLGLVVLLSSSWPKLQKAQSRILAEIQGSGKGCYKEIPA